MAYEDMTYETILQRMINRVIEQYPTIDYREGSIVFNALAQAAIELAIIYTELDNTRKESSVGTASREGILQGCIDVGIDITQFEASAGVHRGEFNVPVPIGSRWNCGIYNFVVTEALGLENLYYSYRMTCETVGTPPNNTVGDLTPITDNPDGLSYAKLVECLIDGENETEDQTIVDYYYSYLKNDTADGNKAQYAQWAAEFDGIGRHKVFSCWDGVNTVKVSILSASNEKATNELVEDFQEYLDPGITGMGDGKAPIGSFVTVTTATEVTIDISATLSTTSSYIDSTEIENTIRRYFRDISYVNDTTTIISYFILASKILDCTGIASVNDVLINGGTSDIIIQTEEIPVLGTCNWTVN